ncbi:hypothetical protein FRC01_010642, partial [Tulasnella sp. 417]
MNTTTTTTAPPATTARGEPIGGAHVGAGPAGAGYGKRGIRRYHPILFGLITAIAIALIGLTAWTHHQQSVAPFGGNGLTRRLDFLIFLACWTTLFGAAYMIFAHTGRFGMIASHASHVLWLFITWVMWLVGAALYQHRLNRFGCGPTHRRCQINRAIEGLSWVEFALCFITMWIIILHVGGKTARYRTGPYDSYA